MSGQSRGRLVISIDILGQAAMRSAAHVVAALQRHRLPATFAVEHPGQQGRSLLMHAAPGSEIALLGHASWTSQRATLARELRLRMAEASVVGLPIHSFVADPGHWQVAQDLLTRHQLRAVRALDVGDASPRATRFGVWRMAPNVDLAQSSRVWNVWIGRSPVALARRAAEQGGLCHFVVRLHDAETPSWLDAFQRLCAEARRAADLGRVELRTVQTLPTSVQRPRIVSRSVLRAA